MKNYYLLALLLAPLYIQAQKKVNLDKYNFTAQFISLPTMRLDSSYRTYNVEIEGSRLMQPYLKDMNPGHSVLLEGWRKLSQNGHISIKVKLEDLLPESVTIKERAENIKDRAGKITGTRILYYEEVIYTFEARASISDYKGSHIMDQTLANRNYKQVYRSPEFPIKALAQGYFLLNAVNKTAELYKNCVNKAMHYLSDRITDNFGFEAVTVNDHMWIVASRKHPEYDEHRQAFKLITDAIFSMKANQPIADIRLQVQPAIKYFESIKNNYPTSKKHDRKIRYASYFNLAVLYYYLDDPQMMMKEAKGLILNDFNAKTGKSFEETALRLKNIFEQTNINTRHFNIDINGFSGPFEKNTVFSK